MWPKVGTSERATANKQFAIKTVNLIDFCKSISLITFGKKKKESNAIYYRKHIHRYHLNFLPYGRCIKYASRLTHMCKIRLFKYLLLSFFSQFCSQTSCQVHFICRFDFIFIGNYLHSNAALYKSSLNCQPLS